MRIEITKPGIFGANGEIPVGTEMNVKSEPVAWAGRYRVIGGAAKGKTAVTNPAGGAAKGYAVADKGKGWFVVAHDGRHVTKSLRADELAGFDAMSDEDKAAFVDLHKAEA